MESYVSSIKNILTIKKLLVINNFLILNMINLGYILQLILFVTVH